jgi:hypothetical protein
MRYGVMHMQQVYVVVPYNIHQGTGKGCLVRWEIEQWVSGHPHFMEKNIGTESGQSYRLLVGDKMNDMPLVGQRFAQLCCQHATSTKCWVTNNANVHDQVLE